MAFFNRGSALGVAAPWQAHSNNTMRLAFTITGCGFILICAVGLIIATALGGIGSLSVANYDRSLIFTDARAYQTLRILMYVGFGAIFVSSIMSLIWVFKIHTASMAFILSVFLIYTVGQGFGFGLLFMVLQAKEAMAVFGIAGSIFLAMGAVGYFFKNLGGLWKFIIAGSIVMLICSIVSMILYFTGVYNQVWIMIMLILSGLLILAYTVFDVWMLRRMSEWDQASGNGLKDRIAWFFGFRLLTDLISVVWIVARLFLRFR